MQSNEFVWAEKYRPDTIDDCILPDALKKEFNGYVSKNEIPNLILAGKPGVGKTTVCLALCKQVECDYLFINASKENGIDTLRYTIENYATTVSLSGGRKVIVLDEFDATTEPFQKAFRASIESYSENCTFLMTANNPNKIIDAIHSRAPTVNFSVTKEERKKLIVQTFKMICGILARENIEYDKEALAAFVTKKYPDTRNMLLQLQRYSVNGKIDVGILTQIGDIQIKDLIQFLKNKEYTKTREWIINNADKTTDDTFSEIYDTLFDHINKKSAPELGIICARYQYQHSMVSGSYIQLLGFLTEVMQAVTWK